MPSEKTRRMGYTVSYLLAAIVLFAMYAGSKTPYGLIGGIVCVGLAIKNLTDWQRLKKKEQEDEHGAN